MRDDDKLVRQLSLVAFLMSQQRPVTADEIHEAVEGYGGMTEQAFLRRFYADRAEIEAHGPAAGRRAPGRRPVPGRPLRAAARELLPAAELDFDQAELSALQTCLYLLEGQFAYAEPLRLALQHLTLGRPSPLDDHAARTVSVNLLGGDYSPEVASHLTKIESAISRRKTIRFTYYSIGRDERSEREVDPYSLLYSAGNWYMVGFAHERGRDPHLPALAHRGPHHLQDARRARLPRAPGLRPLALPRPRAVAARGAEQHRHHRAHPDHRLVGGADVRRTTARTAIGADGSGIYTTAYGNQRELVTWILGPRRRGRRWWSRAELRDAVVAALELVGERHQVDGGAPHAAPPRRRRSPETRRRRAPAPAAAARRRPPERVVAGRALRPPPRADDPPAGRLRRLAPRPRSRSSSCAPRSTSTGKVLEDDIGLLNLINFGGGCYALYAQVEGDTVVVQKETYGDRFARPARLSPLEAKALLWALEFIGDRLPIEADGSLSSVRAKVEARDRPATRLPTVELGRAQVANSGVAAAVSHAIREDRLLEIEYWTESRGAITDAHDRAAPARQRPGRLVRGRLLPPRRRRSAPSGSTASAAPVLLEERFERRAEITTSGPYMPWGARPQPGGTVAQSASVWCSPALARWMLEKHRSRERFADGSVLVEIPYASEDWLVKELLKYQGEAVLFEPVALRRTVAELAERVLARYGERAPPAVGPRRAPAR